MSPLKKNSFAIGRPGVLGTLLIVINTGTGMRRNVHLNDCGARLRFCHTCYGGQHAVAGDGTSQPIYQWHADGERQH
jgi:hypothetical protein